MHRKELFKIGFAVLALVIFVPGIVFASSFVVRSVSPNFFSKVVLGVVVVVCAWVILKIIFVNISKGRDVKITHHFDDLERLYNTSTVLVFSYANAWYRYAPHTVSQALESHDNMRDMRTTATTQIISYLLGRDYMNQSAIKDRSVKERAVLTRSYVPLWADEIMEREPLFRELVIQSLMCGNYLEDLENKNERKAKENVNLGAVQRRNQMINKYASEEKSELDLKDYKSLIKRFSAWDDQYLTLSDAEKISFAQKSKLFLSSR